MSLESLVASWGPTWGPAAVFAGCALEGETSAILGGMIAHRGIAGWLVMAASAAAGAFVADQGWFLLSRHAGTWPRLARLRQLAAASRFQAGLGRHAVLASLIFRFVPGTRILGPVLLAQTGLGWPVFAALDGLSVLVWAGIFTALGYHFGRATEALFGRLPLHDWLWLVLAVGAVALTLHLLWRRRASRKAGPRAG
ncbi:MAG: VTT domain-containing protein [Rhodobacteraceae bacterium]|nr:VTT domain-containing protein [Paracoccaceae bacterium]